VKLVAQPVFLVAHQSRALNWSACLWILSHRAHRECAMRAAMRIINAPRDCCNP
jgi:hypothetical protein